MMPRRREGFSWPVSLSPSRIFLCVSARAPCNQYRTAGAPYESGDASLRFKGIVRFHRRVGFGSRCK